MKLRYIYRLKMMALAMVFGLAAGNILTSCEKEEEMEDVVLHSFGPSGIKHGEQIKFIGLNLDKVTSIILQPGIEITDFDTKTSTLIELTIPKAAEAGKITLKTPQGDIETKTMLSFEVPVVITSITEEARPGSTITITGDLLNWIESITFEDGLLVEEFESQSLTELVVTVPVDAQTGFLIFSTGGTEPLTFASEEELIVTLPAVNALDPGSVRHESNLTLEGTDLDLVTSIVFPGGLEVASSAFVSQSPTQIVVTVPAMTLKGKLTLKQLPPVEIITAQELIIVLPIGTEIAPVPAVPGVDNITITGTDLDLVASLTLPGVEAVSAENFVSHSATEIVMAVPEGTKNGGISYTTIHDFPGTLGVNILVPGEGPKPLALTMYDEAIANGGGDWSWSTGESNPASTEQFYSGDVSWKFTTTSDGGVSAGGMTPGVDGTDYGVFAFSLYGGSGTNGASVAAILNDNWGNYNSVTLVEGQWTDYRLDMSLYPDIDFSNVTRWIFKVEGVTGTTIFVDRVGFDPAGPAPLDYYIYDDAYQNSWSDWGGWGHTTKDLANTEEVIKGNNSIKMVFNDQYGALQIGSPAADVFNGYTTLSFQVHAAEDQDLIVQIGNNSDYYLSIPAGWSLVEIPVADLAGNDDVPELRIKNNNANLPTTLYFDEIGLKN